MISSTNSLSPEYFSEKKLVISSRSINGLCFASGVGSNNFHLSIVLTDLVGSKPDFFIFSSFITSTSINSNCGGGVEEPVKYIEDFLFSKKGDGLNLKKFPSLVMYST